MKRPSGRVTVVTKREKSRAKPAAGSIDELLRRLEAGLESAEKLAGEWRGRLGSRSDTLRSLRVAAGLSQAELARRAGTTQSHVAHIESGEKDPQTDMIARLATALGVAAERVFSAIRGQRGKRKTPGRRAGVAPRSTVTKSRKRTKKSSRR